MYVSIQYMYSCVCVHSHLFYVLKCASKLCTTVQRAACSYYTSTLIATVIAIARQTDRQAGRERERQRERGRQSASYVQNKDCNLM